MGLHHATYYIAQHGSALPNVRMFESETELVRVVRLGHNGYV